MKLGKYTECNRQAWNAVMPHHQKAKKAEWDTCFQQPGFIIQEEPELSKLKEIGIAGKSIIHLCCNNGRELLSLKNMGAAYCLGVDISDEAVKAAVTRSKLCDIRVDYLRSDVYELGKELHGKFDLVYITIGGLVWLPDINRFFETAHQLLKPGGDIFLYDTHPFAEVLPWDTEDEDDAVITNPYFYSEAWEWSDTMDYYGGAEYDAPRHYEFTYTMSDILMGMIRNGFDITFLGEYEHDISNCYQWMQKKNLKFPLSYILTAKKQKELYNDNKRIETGRSEDS